MLKVMSTSKPRAEPGRGLPCPDSQPDLFARAHGGVMAQQMQVLASSSLESHKASGTLGSVAFDLTLHSLADQLPV